MRFLFGLLLVLVLVPSGGFCAPCCDAAPSGAGCPLDRDCTAGEGLCPRAAGTVALGPAPSIEAPPAALPVPGTALVAATEAPAPPPRALRPSRRLPLLN